MRILNILAFILFICHFPLYCQQTVVPDTDRLFEAGRYAAVQPLYMEQLKKEPNNPLLNYRVGICYLNSRSQKTKAAPYFEKAIANTPTLLPGDSAKNKSVPLEVLVMLGDAYQVNRQFDASINSYEKYLRVIKKNKRVDQQAVIDIDHKLQLSKLGMELSASAAPLPATFDTGKLAALKPGKETEINGQTYSVAISPDKSQMIYTIKVPLGKYNGVGDERYFAPINIVAEKDSLTDKVTAKNTGIKKTAKKVTPDTVVNVTTVGSSVDGQIVLSYLDEGGEGNLFIARLKGNKWSAPFRLPKSNNNKGWEPCESMSPDGNSLYFVSDRAGGYGGKDIYRCMKLPNGEWGKAINLGPPVNSAFDDEAPYMHPDGTTLYYSSNRSDPTVGFDHYTSQLADSNSWSKPMMVGYPVDKGSADGFYQVSADKKKNYTAKAVELSKKELKQRKADSIKALLNAENNNYMITFLDQNKTPLTLLKGEVVAENSLSSAAIRINVYDNVTGRLQGCYQPDLRGNYSFVLPSGKNNNITYEAKGSLFQSKNINVDKRSGYFKEHESIKLPELKKGAVVTLNNVFFDSAQSKLQAVSETELNRVADIMFANPLMEISITGHYYANDNFTKALARERAQNILNYLNEKGVTKDRMKIKIKHNKEVDDDLATGKKTKEKDQNREDISIPQKFEMEIKNIKL